MKTRRCFALMLSLILPATAAQAQFITAVGLKAGVAISNVQVTDVTPVAGYRYLAEYQDESVASPVVSLFADFLPQKDLGVQAEVTYLRKGASRTISVPVTTASYPDGTGEVYEVTTEYSLQYLMFALAVQPKSTVGDVTLYAHIGPTASYLLQVTNFEWIERFNRFRLGYTLGLGANIGRLFNADLFVEARFAADFRPFYDQTTVKFWNHSWVMCLGTSF